MAWMISLDIVGILISNRRIPGLTRLFKMMIITRIIIIITNWSNVCMCEKMLNAASKCSQEQTEGCDYSALSFLVFPFNVTLFENIINKYFLYFLR